MQDNAEAPYAPQDEKLGATALAEWILAVGERRDHASFQSLFVYFVPRLRQYHVRSGISLDYAEEVVQETMLALWSKSHLYDRRLSSPSTWVYAISRNILIDSIRRNRLADRYEPVALEAASTCPEQALATKQTDRGVRQAIDLLPAEQACVVRLSYYEYRTHVGIADVLDLPLGTVKSRIRLANRRLRHAFDQLDMAHRPRTTPALAAASR